MTIRVTWYDKEGKEVQDSFHAAVTHEIFDGVLSLYNDIVRTKHTENTLVALFNAGQWHHFEVIRESDATKEPERSIFTFESQENFSEDTEAST